jgi:type I restriction enzyme S subunit
MTLAIYPEYQDTSIPWLGTIPKHWEIRRAKVLFELMSRPVSDTDEIITCFRDGTVTLRSNRRTDGFTNAEKEIGYQGVRVGDLVIHAMDGFAGAIGVSDSNGKSTPVYSVCRPKTEEVNAYYYGMIVRHMALTGYITSLSKGIRERSTEFRWKEIGVLELPLPPTAEQSAIKAFLDIETAKIDALVAEQEKLITLLKEKRQAVISHAVTKGLNPDVKMKDSGVEWLGDVPEHWHIGAVKRFFTSLDGKRIPLSSEERGSRMGEIPYYGASGIIDYVDDFIFEEDLVLVSEDGANLLNRSTPIAFIATGKYWVNNHAHILKPIDRQLRYWSERLESIDLTPVVTGSAQPKLTIEALMNLKIAVPATEIERTEISIYITKEASKLDALAAEAQHGIDLLKERRSALISSAVTGKIDVRGLAA